MNIYVASSWRNNKQQEVVVALDKAGHNAYDFRNAETAFSWTEIDNTYPWTIDVCQKAVNHPIAIAGFSNDMEALDNADLCVIVLPAGRSAHWELGYAAGRKIPVVAYFAGEIEPEIIYRECEAMFDDLDEMIEWINRKEL